MFAHYCYYYYYLSCKVPVKAFYGALFLYMYNSVNMTNVDFSSTFRFVGKGSVQEEKHNCESL